jgi:hypothetical protein
MSLPLLGAGLIALVYAFSPANATGDLNPNLCKYDPVRGAVPAHYALDACVDGNFIVVRNDGKFPVQLYPRRTPDGHTDSPLTFVTKTNTTYAAVTRRVHNNELPGTMVLPGDRVRYEDGDSGAKIRAAINVRDYTVYPIAEILSGFVPILGEVESLKDLTAALRESQAQHEVCRTRPGLHGCVVRREAQQVSAIVTFLLSATPGLKGPLKVAQKVYDLLPAWLLRRDPETALNDFDKVVTQGPRVRAPCLDSARLTIVPKWTNVPSMNAATVGIKYSSGFESILYSSVSPDGMTFGTDWEVSGAPPGFYIGWAFPGETHLNYTEFRGPLPSAAGSFTIDLSATYRSQWTGQTCAVAHYTFPLVITEPPQAP